jgi:hypothetical protein
MEEREWTGYYDLEMVNLPLQRRRGVSIVHGEKMTVWGETGISGWTGNPTGNSRWRFRWNRELNQRFLVWTGPGTENKPSQPKNMSGPG